VVEAAIGSTMLKVTRILNEKGVLIKDDDYSILLIDLI
jgi:hypothetical protein